MITCNKKFLEQRCIERGYDFLEIQDCVVSKNGDMWTIDTNHKSYPSISKNNFIDYEKIKKLKESIINWKNNDFKFSSSQQIQDRLNVCNECEFWDKSSFGGTGKCKNCGCSTWAKLRMATERCPIGKWEAHLTQPTN